MSYQNSFLTQENFKILYNNIRDLIKQNNNGFNIDNEAKYKKILKKLMLSIYDKNKNIDNVNQLNNISINKCIPFLIQIINKNNKNHNIQPYDYNESEETHNVNFKSSTPENKPLESNDDFLKRYQEIEKERQLQISKININNKQSINNLEGNIQVNPKIQPQVNPKIQPQVNNNLNNIQNISNLGKETNELTGFFDTLNPQQTPILENNYNESSKNTPNLNQSNPYLSNLKSKNKHKKSIIIDTGNRNNNLVQNIGLKTWYKFNVKLDEYFIINEKCNIYLENITIQGISNDQNILIDIEEFIINTTSNNKQLNNLINIPNISNNGLLSLNCHKYIGYIQNKTLEDLTISIFNQDKKSIEDGDGYVFNKDIDTNRIILEFSFIES